jgi:catalase
VNYEPNSLNGPVEDPTKRWAAQSVSGETGRFKYQHPNDDFEQPRALFRKVMSETDRTHLINNLVGAMTPVKKDVSISI